jgi:predicted nucleotidyltransferase
MDSLNLEDKRKEYAQLLKGSMEKVLTSLSDKVERISLFGSYAKGVSDLFTDLDILIIMNTNRPFVERIKEVYSALSLPVDVDLLCYTAEEFERIKNRGFFKKILAEEVVLYEKRSH